MQEKERQYLSIAAARLYYQSDCSQQEIAVQLGISRPTVSRLLQHAKEQGYVKIKIFDPLEDVNQLAQQLQTCYSLKQVRVAAVPVNETGEIKKHIGRKAAEFLYDTILDDDIIGVTWGTTMYELARQLTAKPVHRVQIVQLKGGISYSQSQTYASEITQFFAEAFHAAAHHLPLPLLFDSPKIRKMVENDRYIQSILQLGRQANIAIFTVGTVRTDALLFRLGYLKQKEKEDLRRHAVGDIASRFLDASGQICNPQLNARTVGIELTDLKSKPLSLLLAGGKQKLPAIIAALRGGYANALITDHFTAQSLLKHSQASP